MAGASRGVWQLELRLQTFLATEPAGVFEAFFEALAATSDTEHLVQMFDSGGAGRPMSGRPTQKVHGCPGTTIIF
jgi:hypothetical protein